VAQREPMFEQQPPHDLEDVLGKAYAEVAAGDVDEEHTEEIEFHAPLRSSREPVELDTETEAVLRQRLEQSPRE
jgi:hypothetical protein